MFPCRTANSLRNQWYKFSNYKTVEKALTIAIKAKVPYSFAQEEMPNQKLENKKLQQTSLDNFMSLSQELVSIENTKEDITPSQSIHVFKLK